MNPDVVVIGEGIVGTSCAYHLAQSGLKVYLVEKGPIGSGASRAGMSHMVNWEEPEIHLELTQQSNLLYEELSQTLPTRIEYRLTGSIVIVETSEKMDGMQKTVERLQAWGLRCRMLSSQNLLELELNITMKIC
jgi:glycine/D-amino acid oxidase-like deaminating enzyme